MPKHYPTSLGSVLGTHGDAVWRFTWKYGPKKEARLRFCNGQLRWERVPDAVFYKLYKPDGSVLSVSSGVITHTPTQSGTYRLAAYDSFMRVILTETVEVSGVLSQPLDD
jgi:hypothetical protein